MTLKLLLKIINMERRTVYYGNESIEYWFVNKNVKNINIRIKSTGDVFVSANYKISSEIVDNFVKSKGNWITSHKKKFDAVRLNIPPREYVSGEDYMYLGNHYRLRI